MDCLKLFSVCRLVIWLSVLLISPHFCIAGSILIEGEAGRIEIDGVDVSNIESININSNTNSGCVEGSGVKNTHKREIGLFNRIDISGVFDVNIECQKEQCVEVASDDNILPYVVTKVKSRTLFVTVNKSICPKSGLALNISVDNMEKVSVDGASDLVITRVDNEGFVMDLDGSGDIKASGKTGEFVASIEGTVDLNAKNLKSEKVRISVTGASDSSVYASKKLQADISGVGDIYYYGDPEEIIEDISGVGELIKE
jgi:hypothetical protein